MADRRRGIKKKRGSKEPDPEGRNGAFGGFKCMWIVTMFDLPVDTKEARRAYTDFRKLLLSGGFVKMQYSVYMRPCASEEHLNVQRDRIKAGLPPDGEVRILAFTDKQFERIQVFYGKKRGATEKTPKQISFF